MERKAWLKRGGNTPSRAAGSPQRLPAVVLPAGEPEGAVAAVAVCSQMVWKPSSYLGEPENFIRERTPGNRATSLHSKGITESSTRGVFALRAQIQCLQQLKTDNRNLPFENRQSCAALGRKRSPQLHCPGVCCAFQVSRPRTFPKPVST